MKNFLIIAMVLLLGLTIPVGEALAQKYGGQIIIGSIADASYLNPIIESDSASYDINYWIFDSLIRLDENLAPQPVLATDWDISPDGTVITFNLKEGVKWHDGADFSAEDVEFTIHSILTVISSPYHKK